MSYVVIDHHHDAIAGVYRLLIGTPVLDTRPVESPDGEPLLGPDHAPVTETFVAGYENQQDYAFADDDERWAGKTDEQIAALQCELVVDALNDAAAEAPADTQPATRELPGVGQDLST